MECIRSCSHVVSGGIKVLILLGILLSPSRAQNEGDVRLIGPTSFQGTVGVYHNGEWGSICDDSWGFPDAHVVCRQLGFERAERIWYRAYYGKAPGPIWLDQMHCSPNDQRIGDCSSNGWGIHDCRKREDAGVDCFRKEPVKPASLPIGVSCPGCVQGGSCSACPKKIHPDPHDCSPQTAVEGIVFAYYNEEWSPITGEGWDMKDAEVACGELGYSLALGIPSLEELWKNWDGKLLDGCEEGSGSSGPACNGKICSEEEISENNNYRESLKETLFTSMQCVGNEMNLNRCYYSDIGPFQKSSVNVATVRCGFKPHTSCFTHPLSEEIYRTRGGVVPWEGRVEARVDGEWGTICDSDWTIEEGNVVCRALGYGTAKQVRYRASFGRGVRTIHYNRLRCNGSEATLQDCRDKQTGLFAQQCGHQGDAGVVCNAPSFCPAPEKKQARFVVLPNEFHPQYDENYVEVRGSHGWGLICDPYLTMAAANVICRSERRLFVNQVRSGKAGNYTGLVRYNGLVVCEGTEASIEECGRELVYTTQCDGDEHATVDCSNGIPDLVPDLETLSKSIQTYPYIERTPQFFLTCAKEEGCLSSSAEDKSFNDYRSLLRFDSLTMNWGTEAFLPHRERHNWQFHTCHNHFHSFEAFIHYDLLSANTGEKVAEGHKASFCLEDSTCAVGGGPSFRCSSGHQGISANCGDLYGRNLDCQWIDITDVPPGTYILRLIVNPDNLVLESDYGNNEVQCTIVINNSFGMHYVGCSLSDHCVRGEICHF